MATLQDTFAQRQNESAGKINDLYNKQYETQAASLKTTYDKNMSDAQAQRDKIGRTYQANANSLASQYEKSRRAANLNAMQRGLGSGTAMQQQNALNTMYQQNAFQNRANEANAYASADQSIADLKTNYQNALVQAQAESNNKRDAALIEDYNKQQDWYDNQAKTLASYGDFSAYERLYGADQANAMRNTWIAQNPDLAFRTGVIDKAQYKKLTGKDYKFKA